MNIAAALQKTFLFKEFPAAELEKLAQVAKYEKHGHESLLFREGEKGDQLFIIIFGSVKVQKRNADGVEQEVAHLSSGSYFGEMAVVDDEHERSATIITHEQTELLSLAHEDVQKLFAKDDKLAHHFYKALCKGLTRRLRATTQDTAFFKALARSRH
jgi:CRP/FNR family transcriptional regulator, cyclic AMP receptor protein